MGLKRSSSAEKYPYLDFFRQSFTIDESEILDDGNVALYCPDFFHVPLRGHPQTDAPKYYVNLITGAGECKTCKSTHTDAEGFLMAKEGISYAEAKKWLEGDPEPIPDSVVQGLHQTLIGQPKVLGFLHDVKRISLETIKRYRLGFDGERICTPIPDDAGDWANLRKYLRGAKRNKVVSFAKGYGKTRIFPVANLLNRKPGQPLVMFGGEFKVIAADELSLTLPEDQQWASVTTAGEGTMPPYLLRQFAERVKQGDPILYICMDIDDAGRIASQRYANKLIPLGIECRNVRLPITQPANGDFNDYLAQGGTAEDFLRLLEEAEVFHVEHVAESDKQKVDKVPIKAHLSETSQTHLAGKYVQTEVVVAGKDLSPYILPKKVELTCKEEWGEKCASCGLSAFNGAFTLDIDSSDPHIMNLINVPERELHGQIRSKAHITPKCPYVRMNVVEHMNVENVLLIPELDFSAEDREYVTRSGYYVGHGIRANRNYEITALSTADPRSQHATLLIFEADDGKSSVQMFHMTPELFEQLKIFQGAPEEVFPKVARDLSNNVTRIYGRDNILIASDLVFHSALKFYFQGKLIDKGYLECLHFGDTRTGKSETVKNMHRHYRLGEFMDCGNTTFAGLVGGMQQTGGKRWQVTWGKIPLNNGGLVTMDEVSSLPLESIGDMTGIRSSGIAEIVKIQTERTQAMVRMIWISNPRQLNMRLGSYNYGINGIQELIGRPEDIARFDFVTAVAFDETLDKLINTQIREVVPHVFTSELCHSLILWAWTRKPEHIVFTPEAEQACLDWASKMGQDFTPQFPIVISADQRIKIARLAVSAAIRTFNTDDGESVNVEKSHVDWAVSFLQSLYQDPALGYADYSKQLASNRTKAETNKRDILLWMKKNQEICQVLLDFPMTFKTLDLMDMLALEKEDARNVISFLRKHGLVSAAGGAAYRKEEHCIAMLRNPKKFCAEVEPPLDWDAPGEGMAGFKAI